MNLNELAALLRKWADGRSEPYRSGTRWYSGSFGPCANIFLCHVMRQQYGLLGLWECYCTYRWKSQAAPEWWSVCCFSTQELAEQATAERAQWLYAFSYWLEGHNAIE